MFVLVTGGQASANAWVCAIAREVFERSGHPMIDVEALLPWFANQPPFVYEQLNQSRFITAESCSEEGITVQFAQPLPSPSTYQLSNQHRLFLPLDPVKKHVSYLQMHTPLGEFVRSSLRPQITSILFTHRNPLDEMASFSRLYGVTPEDQARLDRGEPIQAILYDVKTNAINFRVGREDARRSLLWKRHTMHAIRDGYIDFLEAKDLGVNVHAFEFVSVTIEHELEEVQRVVDAIGLPADARAIHAYMQASKKPGVSGFHANTAKVGIAEAYFDARTLQQLRDFFGDVMVLFGYQTLASYSPFLAAPGPVRVIRVGEPTAEVNRDLSVLRRLRPIDEVVGAQVSGLSSLVLDSALRYVFLARDYDTYQRTREFLRLRGVVNAIVYPFHEAIYGYREPVFDLDAREVVFLDEILDRSKNLAFVRLPGSPTRDYYEPLRRQALERRRGFVQVTASDAETGAACLASLDRHVIDLAFFSRNGPGRLFLVGEALTAAALRSYVETIDGVEVVGMVDSTGGDDGEDLAGLLLTAAGSGGSVGVETTVVILETGRGEAWLAGVLEAARSAGAASVRVLHGFAVLKQASLDPLPGDDGTVDTAVLCTNRPAEIHALARLLPPGIRKIAPVPIYRYRMPPLFPASGALARSRSRHEDLVTGTEGTQWQRT